MALLIIFGITLIVIAYGLSILEIYLVDVTVGILGVLFIYMGIDIYCPEPTALDVYQGKTALEYTYKNGAKVDSVVVFKRASITEALYIENGWPLQR